MISVKNRFYLEAGSVQSAVRNTKNLVIAKLLHSPDASQLDKHFSLAKPTFGKPNIFVDKEK